MLCSSIVIDIYLKFIGIYWFKRGKTIFSIKLVHRTHTHTHAHTCTKHFKVIIYIELRLYIILCILHNFLNCFYYFHNKITTASPLKKILS